MKTHHYKAQVTWTGNLGKDTANYKVYNRNHTISISGKSQPILASSDPNFLGDNSRYNPEELLLTSMSSCHMLWYLHLCATNNICVKSYVDNPEGQMQERKDGSGQFGAITLHPTIIISKGSDAELANKLHKEANNMCFIANSLNFPVAHKAIISAKN